MHYGPWHQAKAETGFMFFEVWAWCRIIYNAEGKRIGTQWDGRRRTQ